ncbi:MAG: DedA family protein [Actinomycetota bacterium]
MSLLVLAKETTGLAGWAVGLMERLGPPGAALAIALENLFPPLPSEVILPLAGFTASRGEMSLVAALVWTTIGSVGGAVILYYVGALLGYQRTLAIASRMPLIKTEDIERTEAWFERHGTKAIFFGRMIPIFRSLISIPAGIKRMPMGSFLLYTTAGSATWNTVFILAGYFLGENWEVVEGYVGTGQKVVIVVVALTLAWFVTSRLIRMRARRT